jgi:hypothetical protein
MIASVLLRNSGFACSKATRMKVIGLRALSSGPKFEAAPHSNIDEEDNILPVRGDDDAVWILALSPLAFMVACASSIVPLSHIVHF